MKLNNELNALASYPFHMPGHKRNADFGITGSEIDITEIDGYDNLHNPCGILRELEEGYAEAYCSRYSIISVNGSTCGILAAISAVCNNGDEIIIARNCHRSVYNACFINKLRTVYIEPEFDNELGCFGRITQDAVDRAVAANPDASALVITSPTYEGVVSEINCDIPLIIDAAHGAHFGFADYLPKRPSADIVINSLHKTLPALTQTAIVNIYNEKYSPVVRRYMDIFETSSPSYVLLASADRCLDFLKNCDDGFDALKGRIDKLKECVKRLESVHIYGSNDITRLVIYCDKMSGVSLADELRKRGIEPEGATLNYVILIATVCDTDEGFDILVNALKDIDGIDGSFEKCVVKPIIPDKALELFEVNKTEKTFFENAVGKICGEYIYAYPPGIPIIAPGEVISSDVLDYIGYMKKSGVNIISDGDIDSNIILTKK